VYLGIDFDDVNDATPDSDEYMGNYDVNTFDPCGLDVNTIYYWRIDEVSGLDLWKGDVWGFRTWLEPNFISWWKFDEGSGSIAYDSAGNNDGTVYGATWTTGQIDGALSFDGSNDYVDVGTGVMDFSGETSFTATAWINAQNTGAHNYIFGTSTTTGWYARIGASGGHDTTSLLFKIDDGTDEAYPVETSTINIADNAWHFIAVSISGSELKGYIDGDLQFAVPYSNVGNMSDDFNVGLVNASPNAYFNGKIDDVRIYDRALSAEEILQLYQGGLGLKASNPHPADGAINIDPNTVLSWSPGKDADSHDVYLGTNYDDVNDADTNSPEYKGNCDVNSFDPCGLGLDTTFYWRIDERNSSGTAKGDIWSFATWAEGFDPYLIGWWKFDEGTGTTAYDSAGDNDGTVTGATWTIGQIDGALSFDGTNDYVSVSSPASLDDLPLHNMTVCAWIYDKNTSGTTWGTITGCYAYNNGWSFRTYSNSGGDRSLYFQVPHSSGEYDKWANYWSSDGTIIANTWHHVAAVWDGSTKTAKLYIDGAEPSYQTTNPGVGAYNSDASRNKEIGRIPHVGGIQYFNGVIDDVRIYDRALSAWEIWELYQAGL
jgi:hypothetical protein